MTDDAIGKPTPPLAPEAHRVIRALDALETPFGGLLVTRGEGVAVQIDAGTLAGWAGWVFAGAEHIAAPLDVVRRRDGHDVLLPWCTERVASLLARRHVVDEHLSLGECSTLLASVLRGIDELGEPGARERGTWWVTGEGRPVFVIGEGEAACAGAARVVELVAEGCRDRAMGRVLAQVQMGLHLGETQPRVPRRQIEEWEAALLQIAAPRPLRCDVLTPERARDVARAANARPNERQALGRRGAAGTPTADSRRARRVARRGRVGDALTAVQVGAREALGRVARVLSSDRRRSSPPTAVPGRDAGRSGTDSRSALRARPRRRSLLIAGAAAIAVLACGLLWPGGESGEAAERQGGASSTASEKATSAPQPSPAKDHPDIASPTSAPPEAADPGTEVPTSDGAAVAVAPSVLSGAVACVEAAAASCPEVIAEGSTVTASELAEIAGAEPVMSPVDEYGDVAVIRVESSPAARILVLVRMNEKWLVRDVYDVADQPG